MEGIPIQLNGESRVTNAATLADLLEELGLTNRKVAVECNRAIVSKLSYAETPLRPGDELEIIQFVGGG